MIGRPALIGVLFCAGSLISAAEAAAQRPLPPPAPDLLKEVPDILKDERDFGSRSSVTLGSGARALGMGGAFLARADDATAASWNPAGLSYLRKPELSLVGARNSFKTDGVTPLSQTDHFLGYSPDFAALTYPVEIRSVSGAVQVSFQRVFSFSGDRSVNTGSDPEKGGNIRFESSGEGGFDVLAFGTGLQVSRQLRLGGTVNRWFNGYQQTGKRVSVGRPADLHRDFRFSGWNFNLGVIWSPHESLNLGAVAKTSFTGNMRIKEERTDFQIPQTPDNTTTNDATRGDVRLDFPGAFGVGVSWRPFSPFTVSLDYTRTRWSQGRIHNFFEIDKTPPGQEKPPPIVFPSLLYPTLVDAVQEDTNQLRVGLEYVIIGSRLKWPVRAGFFNDKQYFRSAAGGAPRFNGFTFGTGIHTGPFLIDLAYISESGEFADPDGGAEARTRFGRFFASLSYRHGRGR